MDKPDSKLPVDEPELVDHEQSKNLFHSASLLTSNIFSGMKTIYNGAFYGTRETQLTGGDQVESVRDSRDSLNEVGDKQIYPSLNVDSHPLGPINVESARFCLGSSISQEIKTSTDNSDPLLNMDPFRPKSSTVRKILEMFSTFPQGAIKVPEASNCIPNECEIKLNQSKNGCLGLSESSDCNFVKMATNSVVQEDNLSDDSNCSFKSAVSHLDFHSKNDVFDPECKSSQSRNERIQQNENNSWILDKFYREMKDEQSEIKSTSISSRNIFDETPRIEQEIGCVDNEKLTIPIPGYSSKGFRTHLTFTDELMKEFNVHDPDDMPTGINKSQFKEENKLTLRNQLTSEKVDIIKQPEASNNKDLDSDFNVRFRPRKFNSVAKTISSSSIPIKNNADSDIPISTLSGNVLGGRYNRPIPSTSYSKPFPRRYYYQVLSGINMFSNSNNLSQIKDKQCNILDNNNSVVSNVPERSSKRTNSKEDHQKLIPAHKLRKIESDRKVSTSLFSSSTQSVDNNEHAEPKSKTNPPTLENFCLPKIEANQTELVAAAITCIKEEIPLIDISNETTCFSNAESIRQDIQGPDEETEHILQDGGEDLSIIEIKNLDGEILSPENMQKDDDEVLFIESVSRESKVEVETTNSKNVVHIGKRKERETDIGLSADSKEKKNTSGEVRENIKSKKLRFDSGSKERTPLILSRSSRKSYDKSVNREKVAADNNSVSQLDITEEEDATTPKNGSLFSTPPLTDDVKRVFGLLRPGYSSALSIYSADDLASMMCDDSVTDNSISKYSIESESLDHLHDVSNHDLIPNLDTPAVNDFSVSTITDTNVEESFLDISEKLQAPPHVPLIPPVQQSIPQGRINRSVTETPQLASNRTTASRNDFSVSATTDTNIEESLLDDGAKLQAPSHTPLFPPVQQSIPQGRINCPVTDTQLPSNYSTSSRKAKSKARAQIREILQPTTAESKRKRV